MSLPSAGARQRTGAQQTAKTDRASASGLRRALQHGGSVLSVLLVARSWVVTSARRHWMHAQMLLLARVVWLRLRAASEMCAWTHGAIWPPGKHTAALRCLHIGKHCNAQAHLCLTHRLRNAIYMLLTAMSQ